MYIYYTVAVGMSTKATKRSAVADTAESYLKVQISLRSHNNLQKNREAESWLIWCHCHSSISAIEILKCCKMWNDPFISFVLLSLYLTLFPGTPFQWKVFFELFSRETAIKNWYFVPSKIFLKLYIVTTCYSMLSFPLTRFPCLFLTVSVFFFLALPCVNYLNLS